MSAPAFTPLTDEGRIRANAILFATANYADGDAAKITLIDNCLWIYGKGDNAWDSFKRTLYLVIDVIWQFFTTTSYFYDTLNLIEKKLPPEIIDKKAQARSDLWELVTLTDTHTPCPQEVKISKLYADPNLVDVIPLIFDPGFKMLRASDDFNIDAVQEAFGKKETGEFNVNSEVANSIIRIAQILSEASRAS